MFNKSKIVQNLFVIAIVCFLFTFVFGILYYSLKKSYYFELKISSMKEFLQSVDSTNSSKPKVHTHKIGGVNE